MKPNIPDRPTHIRGNKLDYFLVSRELEHHNNQLHITRYNNINNSTLKDYKLRVDESISNLQTTLNLREMHRILKEAADPTFKKTVTSATSARALATRPIKNIKARQKEYYQYLLKLKRQNKNWPEHFSPPADITVNEAEQEVNRCRRQLTELTKIDINHRRAQIRLELKKSNLKRAFRMAEKKEHSLSYFSTLGFNNQITYNPAKMIKSATQFFEEKQKIPRSV